MTQRVGSNRIANTAITGLKLADNSVRGNNIVAGTITGNLIAPQAITGDDLADNVIRANNVVSRSLSSNTFAANLQISLTQIFETANVY